MGLRPQAVKFNGGGAQVCACSNQVIACLAEDALGIEVVENPALAVAATVPDDAYPPVTYWWAETRQARSARTDDFAAFLEGTSARDLLGAAGLEVSK